MEESNIYDSLTLKNPPSHVPNTWDPADPTKFPGPTQLIIPTYLCPSTATLDVSRSEEFRIQTDSKWVQAGVKRGKGMGATDYGGIAGPGSNMIDPLTTLPYGIDHGVLLNYNNQKTLPGLHCSKIISPRMITDGLSKTMCVAELTGRGYHIAKDELRGTWSDGDNVFVIETQINAPNPYAVDNTIFSDHPNGAQILLCDGSVQFLMDNLDVNILCALATKADGETIPAGILGN